MVGLGLQLFEIGLDIHAGSILILRQDRHIRFLTEEAQRRLAASPRASKLTRTALRGALKAHYPRVIAIEYGSASPAEVAICSGGGNGATSRSK